MKKNAIFIIFLFFTSCIFLPAHALEEKEEEKKSWVSYNVGRGIKIEGLDFTIKPKGTFVLQGTPDPNNAGSGKLDTSWIVCVDIEKKLGQWGNTFVRFEQGAGETVTPDLSLFNDINYNAYAAHGNIRARKFWYQQYLLDKQFIVSVGKFNAKDHVDQNKYADDDDIQFLTYMFNLSPVVEWPTEYSFGICADIYPKAIDFLDFKIDYFEADANWRNIFEHGLYAASVNFKPASLLGISSEEWNGNYRFYGWINSRRHSKIVAQNQAQRDSGEVNYGFSTSFDQELPGGFGAFGRFGWQRPDVIPASPHESDGATIEWAWSLGAQMDGRYWRREKDILAFAVGQLVPSEKYKDTGNPHRSEGHIETYYRYYLTDYFTIGPDFQLIWNPHGTNENPVFVYGVRTHMVF